VGAALIGLRKGDTFGWVSDQGRPRSVRIDQVAPDPAALQRRRAAQIAALPREVEEILCIR
jgi:hypothetical protein